MVFVKRDVGGADSFGDIRGGYHFGMIGFGNIRQTRHYALNVHNHHFDGAGDDRQFLLKEVAGHLDAAAHQDFIGGTAEPGQIDAFGSGFGGIFPDFRIVYGGSQHFRQRGLMAMHDNVYFLLFQHAEIGAAAQRFRSSEHDIGNFGRDAGAAPAVGQRGFKRHIQQIAVVMVHAHVGAVH